MGDPRLTAPRIRVVRDGMEEIELQAVNADLVLWDRTAAKHKWPNFKDAPFLWLTFLSWSAARRTGAINQDFSYERWEAETLSVASIEDDDEDDMPGGPTLPGLDPG